MTKKKSLILTGATGFLGSRLLRSLIQEGYKVSILKRSQSNTERIEDLLPLVRSFDLDRDTLSSVFQEEPIHSIIHTATIYGTGESISEVFSTNTSFPLDLLESGLKHGIRHFINTDTSLPSDLSPYAASKKQFAKWGRTLAEKHRVDFSNILLEHMYGPGENPSRLPSFLINSCLKNVKSIPLTPGKQKRDFIYIDDVIRAFLLIVENDLGSGEFPLGSGIPVSVKEFATLIKEKTQSDTTLDFSALPYRSGELMHSQADTSKLNSLGWNCLYSLEEGLRKSIKHCQKEYC
ncbi:MAG: CDP-paratose synthetase [Chlamydiales bacterium]|jgi:CDP-paratose synthetase